MMTNVAGEEKCSRLVMIAKALWNNRSGCGTLGNKLSLEVLVYNGFTQWCYF